ncbi:3-hexulose-6-phosphate synthase, partial [Clavibacter michiganensis]
VAGGVKPGTIGDGDHGARVLHVADGGGAIYSADDPAAAAAELRAAIR